MDQPQQPNPNDNDASSSPPKRPRIIRTLLLIVLAAAIVIQFVPVDRTNPAVAGAIAAPPEVQAVLKRSCYDCHSHETAWPWYSYIAPISWLIAEDVHEGREHMNFSTWQSYDAQKQADLKREAWEEVEEGEMPLGNYLTMHAHAKLTEYDQNLIRDWANETANADD